jgi:acetyltransferase-like isoleucine patch superfamily enzyme
MTNLGTLLHQELKALDIKRYLLNACARIFPDGVMSRARTATYRLFGIKIGNYTTIVAPLHFSWLGKPFENLVIGESCYFNFNVLLDTTGLITIGDGVTFGHNIKVITSNHEMSHAENRAGDLIALPVTIGSGCWIGADVTILPGVTIGNGVVIAAGAVVTKSMPDNVLIGGVPAKVIKEL